MNWVKIAALSELEDDVPIGCEAEKKPIGLVRHEGEVYAFSNICTHQYAHMSEGYFEGGLIECPLHQGCFDIRTGKAQGAPVTVDLQTYPVKIEGDDIYIALP